MPEQGWRAASPLLARRPFRLLVGGQVASQLADGLAQITFAQVVLFEVGAGATPWEITKLLLVTLLPFSLVGPFAGILIDRYDRRRVMAWISLFRAALVATSILVLVLDSQTLAYAAVLLLLSSSRFVLAAKGAALPRTVPGPQLVTGNAVSAIAGMTASFMGAVGGSVVVAPLPAVGFLAATIAYLVAAGAFRRLPPVGGGEQEITVLTGVRRGLAELRDGLRVVVHDAAVRRPLLAVWADRMLLGFGFILLVLVADARYDLEAPGYGLALAVTGVGAFAGSWLAPLLSARFQPTALLPLPFLVGALAAGVVGFGPNLASLVLGVGVVAFSFQVLKVLVDALVQEASPDAVRGRVFSVYDVLYNLAFVLAGLAMIPLWDPAGTERLLWWLAVAFVVVGLSVARTLRVWPFTGAEKEEAQGRTSVPHRWWWRVGALAVGALPALAFPEVDLGLLAFVGLVPLLVLVLRAPNRREAVWATWMGGAGFFLVMHHWLVPSVGPFAIPLALALGLLWIPAGWCAWALLARKVTVGRVVAAAVVVPGAFVLGEFVRSWDRLGGPWGLLGATQWEQAPVRSLAAIGGVWLISFVVVAVNVVIAAAVRPGVGVRARVASLVVLVVAGVSVVGAATLGTPSTSGELRVAMIQPGHIVGPMTRFDAHVELTEQLRDGPPPDLVVWAESSVGFDLADEPDEQARVEELAAEVGAPILVNVDARRGAGGIFKSSVLITPEGVAGRYDKMRLVPFGEYVPLRPLFSWVTRVTEAADEDRRRGDELALLGVDDVSVGPLVCFESAFPDLTRRLAEDGADVIVVQTATTTFQGSWAQAQHASLSAIRAAESGRAVVHAAISGVSAAFDAEGHEIGWLDNDETGILVVDVPLTGGTTPYVRFGDWVVALSVAVLLGATVVAALRAAPRRAGGAITTVSEEGSRTGRAPAAAAVGGQPSPSLAEQPGQAPQP